ncbi:multiple sugar transport system substrate-binding protein [Ruminiclostridium sufflavum DSM 19573]|uniref:Multiple sugar transport system substrate-binding protein n=1 Tax=Ruminiclostridium sufflavum DSM 19573 TaxID=1121337 RepID=A0A318XKD3_9FIRM|nr:extracellular solute-binding protein [Ruminiclostridium sufflavum]PYG86996.1 multiple sugar transport system substrate-binding protein [Ruminiclostridium sufflavum DSM 19573]
MRRYKALVLCALMAGLIFNGCSKTEKNIDVDSLIKPSDASAGIKLADSEKSGEGNTENEEVFDMIIWNNSLDSKYIENAFSAKYPDANLKIVSFDAADTEKVTKALASNETIDIITYYREGFGNFNSIDVFEDLLQPQYDFDSIKSVFNEREIEQCKSFDDSKLIALPFPEYPMVTYYRADILGQYGFPTDPEELAEYMSTTEGWMKIAAELKKHDIYAIQWKEELLQKVLRSYAFYDDDMKLNINNEKIRETLKLTLAVSKANLSSRINIWGEDGQKAIKDGKIAMLYVNKWGENYLKSFVPEQAGKWRATSLPLDVYGYQSSSYASIVSSSKLKMQAWEILKRYMVNDYDYIDKQRNAESEFLGGQKSMQLYEDLINKMPLRYPTILDDRDYSTFFDILYNNMDQRGTEEILNLAISKIDESTYHEQKVLAEYLKENRKK